MPAPLDPVIEKIIPLLPLRDPRVMTPQSARDALRQLAASRAEVPPPPVEHVKQIAVAGGGRRRSPRASTATARARRRRLCSSTAAAGSPAISRPMIGRRATS